MNLLRNAMLAGLLLLAALAPAFAGTSGIHSGGGMHPWVYILITLAPLAGAVTVTYKWPVQSTVAPTAAQMKPLSMVNGNIQWADADTVATITHNFQMATVNLPGTSSLVSEASCGFPVMVFYASASGAAAAILTASATINSITAQVSKTSLVGSGGTIEFSIQRPTTLTR
jgi:hypothetical protein